MDATRLQYFIDRHKFRQMTGADGAETVNVFTGPVRLAFTHLDPKKPKMNKQNVAKWGALLIVPTACDISPLMATANRVATQRFGANWLDRVKTGDLKFGLKKSDKLAAKYKGFEGSTFFLDTASNFEVPMIKADKTELLYSSGGIYAGAWCLARVRVYTYPKPGADASMTKGVGIGLESLMKIADDDQLAGGGDATEGFDDVAVHPSVAAAAMNGGAAAPVGQDVSAFLS